MTNGGIDAFRGDDNTTRREIFFLGKCKDFSYCVLRVPLQARQQRCSTATCTNSLKRETRSASANSSELRPPKWISPTATGKPLFTCALGGRLTHHRKLNRSVVTHLSGKAIRLTGRTQPQRALFIRRSKVVSWSEGGSAGRNRRQRHTISSVVNSPYSLCKP